MTSLLRMSAAALVLPVMIACSTVAMAQDGIRTETVHFQKGATSSVIHGRIKGRESVSYKIGASAGQTLRVSLDTHSTAAYFNVYGPGKGPGDEAIANSEMTDAINVYEGTLPETGEYTVSVYLVRSAARRGEAAKYQLSIGVDAAGAAMQGDAKVAGTNFHATGEIPCSMGNGAPAGSCPFGVERQGNGSAVVTITMPDGRPRLIFFDAGEAVGYNMSQADNQHFWASKEGDLSTVLVGKERYEIPDAVPFGG